MICVPIAEPNAEQARRAMIAAATRSDIVEIRLDQFDALPDAQGLASLLNDRPCPVIVTNRPAALGGRHDWPGEVRARTLQAAIDLGVDYVDIELELNGSVRRRVRTRIIASYHNFSSTPLNLKSIYDQLVASRADVVKLATTANSIIDNMRMFDVIRAATVPCIGLCMGELGLVSRVLGRKFGAMLTYAPMDPAKATASGQVSLDDMIGLFNYREIDGETQVYGVIGNPVAHSIGPHVHNAAFRSLGLNAVYVPFKVEGDVVNFIDAARGIPVLGYSVTVPHKEAVMPALDELDATSRSIGAVNTVVNRKGRLQGTNTDWSAAVEAIETALAPDRLAGKRVALIGAGGTARAIAFGLRAKGAVTAVYDRTFERAQELAADFACEAHPLDDLLLGLEADVVINSTSVGMHPDADASPVPADRLRPEMVVFDAIYNPVWTRLLADAEEAGCVTVTGLDMFVNQAVQQFKTWTGLDAPRELMTAVAAERLTAAE